MSNTDPLRDALRHRADQLGDASPLTLDDVKGRAQGIRRRRMVTTGVAAAAVLAVAVPAGIAVTDRVTGRPDAPPVAGPSETPSADGSPTSSPTPRGPVRIALTTEVDGSSYGPGIPYLYDGSIVRADGSELDVQADYTGLAQLGEDWVALRNDEGNFSVDVLDGDGSVRASDPSTFSLAVSSDGTVVSYATPDGELKTVVEGAEPTPLVEGEFLPGGLLDPVAVIGSGSCEPEAAGGGCTVLLNGEEGERSAAYSITAKGIVGEIPRLLELGGMAADGSLSGVTSVSEVNSACSVVLDSAWKKSWETCDHTLGQFSPDGRFVIGHPAQQDGIGDSSVAILDARTGDLLAEATNSAEHQSFINNVVWDTDNTLLMTVFEEGSWSLLRMTPAGELTEVLGDLGDNMDEVPLHLATQP